MSAVSPSRLQARRTYRGFLYGKRGWPCQNNGIGARLVEFPGAEWRQMLAADGLSLHTVADDPGCLHAKRGAQLVAEIYEGLSAGHPAPLDPVV